MSQQQQVSLAEQLTIGLGSAAFAVLFTAPSLDTPVSHLMLAARTRRSSAQDLEKQDAVDVSSEDLVDPFRDNLLSATRKLWKAEEWRGFVKGFLPDMTAAVLSLTSSVAIDLVLVKIISSRRTGPWKLINALLAAAVKSILVGYLVNPLVILRTRMRLQSVSRTTREEIQYLARRVSPTDLFSAGTVVPAFIRYAITDGVRALFAAAVSSRFGDLPAPGSGQQVLASRVLLDFLSNQASTVLGTALAFPFIRCQELAAATLRPLERPSVRIHEYHGLADEIVQDSAWYGFLGSLQRTVLVALANVAFVLPPYFQLQSQQVTV